MPRNYHRKNADTFEAVNILAAIKLVKGNPPLGVRAATSFGVSHSTLLRYITDKRAEAKQKADKCAKNIGKRAKTTPSPRELRTSVPAPKRRRESFEKSDGEICDTYSLSQIDYK